MTFIEINDSKDVLISNGYFDGDGKHIVANGVENLRAVSNIHLNTRAIWSSFAREIIRSKLKDKDKLALLNEAQTLLKQPKKGEIGQFESKLNKLAPLATQFFTQLAANLLANPQLYGIVFN